MEIKSVFDKEFARYGKVLEGYDFAPLLKALKETTPKPAGGTVYLPSDGMLEALPVYTALQDRMYGGMPIEIGYCNGCNRTLNCLEYHRDSEVNLAAEEIVLLLAPLQSLREGRMDTALVEAFAVPAGTAVQLYETTLHYAPCNAPGKDGFQVAVILPRGTNSPLPELTPGNLEDKLLWARNKWLVAHPDSGEAREGAFVGLTGENITVEE